MAATGATAILFDCFGTLVDYSPSRTEQGYHGTHAVLRDLGVRVTYERFLATWVAVGEELDRRSDLDDREYAMPDVARAFLTAVGADDVATHDPAVHRVVDRYLAEWCTGVRRIPGVGALLDRLAGTYRLAVVSNTHDPGMVPALLDRMGVRDRFAAVVTSVEVGRRKPHPAIYEAAVRALGVAAGECVFVGDTYVPDYLGPRRAGMAAFLVDPGARHDVPAGDRLGSVLDLADALGCVPPS